MNNYSGKHYFVYGSGLSGKAACRALKRCGARARIYTDCDGRFVAPPSEHYDGAVVSPGIKHSHAVYAYCKERGIPVIGEAEIGFELAAGRTVVGVTGTNGKTTATRMIAEMTGGTACGNIGYPITTAAQKTSGTLVCELSSFQLAQSRVTPTVAVITNLAPDHLDWHGSAEAYYADKCSIAANMHGGYLILGEDIHIGMLSALEPDAEVIMCSTTAPSGGAYTQDGYFCFDGKRVCPIDYLRVPGNHNIKNALCAIAAAKCLGVDNADILAALSTAVAAPHRTEYLGVHGKKTWINDSKGTNISACLAAVESTPGELCLILGGRNKNADFSELFNALDKRVTEIVAMGESAQVIRDSAAECRPELKVAVVSSLDDAVKAAARLTAPTVLLSPACASFDEFSSYEERGDRFKTAVKAIGKRK